MPGTQTGLAHDHHTWRSFCLAAWIRNFSAYSGVSPLSWEKQPGSVQGPVNSLCDLLPPRPQFSLPIQGWHRHHGKPRLKKKSHNGITQPGMWCMPVTGVPSRLKQEGIYELVPGQVGSQCDTQSQQNRNYRVSLSNITGEMVQWTDTVTKLDDLDSRTGPTWWTKRINSWLHKLSLTWRTNYICKYTNIFVYIYIFKYICIYYKI